MRLINFLLIFVVCLALALFSIQNPQFSTIQIVPGVEVQAPLSIEIIVAMGIGAVLAWLFSIWTGLQRQLAYRRAHREIRDKDEQIQALKQDVEEWKAVVEKQPQFLPGSEVLAEETSTAEVIAQ
ncbi:MAG: LapA family protein [Xenococcaceae cyanobacterium]